MEIPMALFLIAIIILLLSFIGGIILAIIGKYKRKNRTLKVGLVLFIAPILICVSILIYKNFERKRNYNLDITELVGSYKILNNSSKDGEIFLRLYADGRFETSTILSGEICDKGKYTLYSNEVWFRCENRSIIAKTDRGLKDLNLKFNFHNPENGEMLVVQKVE